MKLGEAQRQIEIAEAYGVRLGAKMEVMKRLILGSPSHGFVIDGKEAQAIFPSSGASTELEQPLAQGSEDGTKALYRLSLKTADPEISGDGGGDFPEGRAQQKQRSR